MVRDFLVRLIIVSLLVARALAAETPAPGPGAVSGILHAARFAGADWGATVGACIAALPSDGGICDARELHGAQKLSVPLIIAKNNVRILLSATSIHIASGVHLDILGSDVSIVGIGKQASSFVVGADAGIRIGNSSTVSRKWLLQGVGIVAESGTRPQSGIELRNAREGRLEDMLLTGFDSDGASAIVVSDNSWTVLLDDVNISSNSTGISFHGSSLNAWILRSCIIVRNGVGVLFDTRAGTGQGIAFTDGTHFEGNRSAGILFRSGDFQEISVTNAYVEAYAKQGFVVMEGEGDAPIRVRSFHFSMGHIYTSDQPPFRFDATQASADAVVATIEQVHYRTSSPGTPIAVFRGTRARGVVIAPVAVDARETYARADEMVKNVDGAGAVTLALSQGTPPALQVTTALSIGSSPAEVSPITGHYSAVVQVQFNGWSGFECQDRLVRVHGAREGDSVALGLPPAAASQPGVQFMAFVTSTDVVTVRGCKVTAGSGPSLSRPLALRVDVWRH